MDPSLFMWPLRTLIAIWGSPDLCCIWISMCVVSTFMNPLVKNFLAFYLFNTYSKNIVSKKFLMDFTAGIFSITWSSKPSKLFTRRVYVIRSCLMNSKTIATLRSGWICNSKVDFAYSQHRVNWLVYLEYTYNIMM